MHDPCHLQPFGVESCFHLRIFLPPGQYKPYSGPANTFNQGASGLVYSYVQNLGYKRYINTSKLKLINISFHPGKKGKIYLYSC